MTADPERSVAVFLGPSLPLEAASGLLDAHYLPPAQFGDVYRLIGSGVRTLVLIDGVFHGRAAVWQRELLCALRNGIHVFGASSMGALRAAELHAHGMVGIGTIFHWYASGEIDGDDEVALLHAGPELRYRPLTQPLVNLRFNLREAVSRGVLQSEQGEELVAALKALPFWERTADALWNTPAFRALEAPCQERLRAFFERDAMDLKRRDAAQALAEVARRRGEPPPVASSSATGPRHSGPSHHDRFRLLKRSFSRVLERPMEGQTLIEQLLAAPADRQRLQWSLAARFFAREWARDNGVSVPVAEASALSAAFHERVVSSPLADWLRANRLTPAEYGESLEQHILWTWLLAQPPERWGLSSRLQDEALLPPFPGAEPWQQQLCSRAELARALPYVAAWCQSMGAEPWPEAAAVLAKRWHGALASLTERDGQSSREPYLQAVWALERGPAYFGYATWSLAVELLRELQLSGAVAGLAARWGTEGG